MVTLSASSASSDSARAAQSPKRGLWHAPLFVLGATAVLFVGLLRPTLGNPVGRRIDRELHTLRRLLTRPDTSLEDVARRAALALDAARQAAPDREGEAHLLLGVVWIHLAERAAGDQAVAHWRDARANLEEAEQSGVAEADRARLRFRLLQAAAHTGEEPRRVAEGLAPLEVPDEDRADYYVLLTQACLDQTPPDLNAALEANKHLRETSASEAILMPARLLGGELKLRLRRPAEARKDLEKVGPQAPAALRIQAKVLLGRSYQDEGLWGPAARVWEEAKSGPGPLPARPLVLYHLGYCYVQIHEPAKAAAVWRECADTAPGDEGPAAALGLADVALEGPDPAVAVQYLTRAVKGVSRPEEWKNSLIDLAAACTRFEQAAQKLRQAGRFDLIVPLCEPYGKLAPDKALLTAAAASADWARLRREQAAALADPAKKREEEQSARELALQAATSYKLAAGDGGDDARENALWLAASCYRDAGDLAEFEKALRRCLDVTQKPARKGEGWFLLGEALRRQSGREVDAEQAYLQCIAADEVPFVCRARYQLALKLTAAGRQDDAEAALEQNLKRLRTDRDPETQEKTLLALGRLSFQRRKYGAAATHLEEALSLGKQDAPSKGAVAPETVGARFLLAQSYQELAAAADQALHEGESLNPDTHKHLEESFRRWAYKAAQEYGELRSDLERPEAHGQLNAEEEIKIPFYEAACWFNYGNYKEALQIYEALARRYSGTVDGLEALGGIVRCAYGRKDGEMMQQRIAEIREALHSDALKDLDEKTRAHWEAWLNIASKSTP